MKLKRSKDRKVANIVNSSGTIPAMANSFGLPAGLNFSCPGITKTCEKICYAGRLEKIYKGVRKTLMHNWLLLKDADYSQMYNLINEMICEFKEECIKRKAPLLFRIHWDGDFFNDIYVEAWKEVILKNPDIRFWTYTRVNTAAIKLKDISNLGLYFSTDPDNKEVALKLKKDYGVNLAYLAENFSSGVKDLKFLTGKSGGKCPENAKKIPLISKEGSACVTCHLCIKAKVDIIFSSSKT